ncbi:hypothetical protein ACFRCW_32675 [Streptomyces sp. NPDC056653]|uniref:hypothetical protein n=1 Tax=Streptomyces sp. NPDC056653 TaxID=3345894 RepID=UPI0036AA9540
MAQPEQSLGQVGLVGTAEHTAGEAGDQGEYGEQYQRGQCGQPDGHAERGTKRGDGLMGQATSR